MLKRSWKRVLADGTATGLIWGAALLTVGVLLFIVAYILFQGLPHIDWPFITDVYRPGLGQEGILPMIISTLYLIGVALLIAVPVGVLAAIYLAEYAKEGPVLQVIRFATESLAGIPSIIYGLFGYAFFVTAIKLRMSILAGSLTVALMIIPIIVRTTEEALRAVPRSYREGSLALGASQLTTIRRVVLPTAIGGILTSVILSVGRIVGETAAVIYTMGSAVAIPRGIASSGRSLSVHLYFLAKEGTSVEQSHAAAAVLLILVALINMLANVTARKYRVRGGSAR